MNFEDLCTECTRLSFIESDEEYEDSRYALGNHIDRFLTANYPELLDQLDANDDDGLIDCLDTSNTERDFILKLIYHYSVSIYDLMKTDQDKLLEQYLKLKNL